jgi:hypothetical protein
VRHNGFHMGTVNRLLVYYAESQLISEKLGSTAINEVNILKRIGLITPNVNLVQFKKLVDLT